MVASLILASRLPPLSTRISPVRVRTFTVFVSPFHLTEVIHAHDPPTAFGKLASMRADSVLN